MRRIFEPLLAAVVAITAQTALVATTPANAGVPGSRSEINLDAIGAKGGIGREKPG